MKSHILDGPQGLLSCCRSEPMVNHQAVMIFIDLYKMGIRNSLQDVQDIESPLPRKAENFWTP